jgi:hypothetical protein
MNTFLSAVGALVVAVSLVVVVGLLMSFPVMWLWNGCLVPAIVGIKELGLLQAWGILILCGLLFKHTGVDFKSK